MSFDASTAEETIGAWVSACDAAEALLPLLPEQHPLYAGRSTNETSRIRGFILAAFARTGLPDEALPYALEELESGHDPYLVAAAARALRGAKPDPAFAAYLRKARRNVEAIDAPVSLDAYKPRWPYANPTSAMEEIRKTLASIEERDCCELAFSPSRTRRAIDLSIELEDQDGRPIRFGDFVRGRLTVVAFFYTRCDNPEKCSLTISRLAQLQQALDGGPLQGQVRLAAITYDPRYDLPRRMRLFGANRGFRFDDDARFFRAPDGFDALRASFDLGVNFASSLVNRHRIELYVLDANGVAVATFTRMQWSVAAVVAELQSQLAPPPPARWHPLLASLPALLLALLPKCPLCLGAYLSAFGLGGMQIAVRSWWTIPLTLALLLLHLALLHRRTRRTRDAAPLLLATLGALALIAGSVLWNLRPVGLGGAALLAGASVLSAMARPPRAHREPSR